MKKEVFGIKKGQFSVEYLLMMGFTMLLLLPTIILFVTESQNIRYDISASQATQIARKIADKAEEMYYQGEPSKTTLKVYIPTGVFEIRCANNTIAVSLLTPDNAEQEILQFTAINITGNFSTSSGIYYIEIKSEGDFVSVKEI